MSMYGVVNFPALGQKVASLTELSNDDLVYVKPFVSYFMQLQCLSV